MFESLDDREKREQSKEPVTLGEALGVYVLILLLALGSVLLFITLREQPYGLQIVTAISYTGVVCVWTFFRTRGIKTKHSLGDQYVQDEVPRMLVIHLIYLVVVVLLQMLALRARPSLSPWWTRSDGPKGMPPYVAAMLYGPMVVAISEIVVARRLLARAKRRAAEG